MARTFEELASDQIDSLYRGALFLTGGAPARAERLVVETLVSASSGYAPDVLPSPERWLEGALARSALPDGEPRRHRTPSDGSRRTSPAEALLLERLSPDDLLSAAGRVPALARATLWLVTLRRWSYAEAADALGLAASEIPSLLEYRDLLLRSALESAGEHPREAGGG